ncbi:hypothetical protein [Saccharothrix hoggarensis]|uniref:PE family protein n=1 Tax=Saccharothrix hoggarensis TaxID=913853 RepID=A0ABW3R5V3_9PSEU
MWDAESGGGAERIGFVADTVNVVGGAAGGMVGAPPPMLVATQTEFSVDPEQAQKLIDGLAEARNQLQELNRNVSQLMFLPATAKDPYSALVIEAIQRTAGPEVGGYAWANNKAAEALSKTIQKIQASLANYKGQDEATADAFNGGGK